MNWLKGVKRKRVRNDFLARGGDDDCQVDRTFIKNVLANEKKCEWKSFVPKVKIFMPQCAQYHRADVVIVAANHHWRSCFISQPWWSTHHRAKLSEERWGYGRRQLSENMRRIGLWSIMSLWQWWTAGISEEIGETNGPELRIHTPPWFKGNALKTCCQAWSTRAPLYSKVH